MASSSRRDGSLLTEDWLSGKREKLVLLDDGAFASRVCSTPCPEQPTRFDAEDQVVCEALNPNLIHNVRFQEEQGDWELPMPNCEGSTGIADLLGYFRCDGTQALETYTKGGYSQRVECQMEVGIHLCADRIRETAAGPRYELRDGDLGLFVFLHEAAHAYFHSSLRLNRRHPARGARIEETLAEFVALSTLSSGQFLTPWGEITRLGRGPLVDVSVLRTIIKNDDVSWYNLGARAFVAASWSPGMGGIQEWFRWLVHRTEEEWSLLSESRPRKGLLKELHRLVAEGIANGRRYVVDVDDRHLWMPKDYSPRLGTVPLPPCERYRIIEHRSPTVISSAEV